MQASPRTLRWLCLSLLLVVWSPSAPSATPANWTTGPKKVLVIPVRFTDQAGPSDDPGPGGVLSGWGNMANGTTPAQLSAFMAQQSYGRCTLTFTVLPEIDLGASYTVYNAPLNSDSAASKFTRWYEAGSFADDVRAKARQVGAALGTPALYDTDNYDLDIIATGFVPGQSTAATALTFGKGIYANVFTPLAHELCHNLGLSHAQGVSRATFAAPLIRNTFLDNKYANVFDLMGFKETNVPVLPPDRDAGVYWKYALGWLPPSAIATPASSGLVRVYAFDQGTLEAGKSYALRIVRDPTHTYWFEYRTAITGPDAQWTQNGLLVYFGAEDYGSSAGNTILLDMTPGSRGLRSGEAFSTMHDAPLALGRTYSDDLAQIHVTPLRKAGTVPEALDVMVNFGPFPGNRAPTLTLAPASVTVPAGTPQTFTATAADLDGDTLAYYWEFDDPDAVAGVATGGSNPDTRLATQGTHTWTRTGTHFVRCTVTDMKGGKKIVASTVNVTGGTSPILTISGTVVDENGVGIAGAVVNNFSVANGVSYDSASFCASGETAADGKYSIQLPYAGPNAVTYRLAVLSGGYSFNCNVAGGAITVTTTSRTSINFTRVRANRTLSGAIVVAGRGYDPATDGPITIGTGTQNVAGTSFYSVSVPDGSIVNLTATPDNPTYSVSASFSNPHLVVADYNVFAFLVNIPGKMPETGFASAGAVTDDTVGTVQVPLSMTLPAGQTSWPAQQDFFYWVDASGTAEYGVDYKASGGVLTYYAGKAPGVFNIPLKIVNDGRPKDRTVVLKVGISNGVSNLGPITTYTHRIVNPFAVTSSQWVGGQLQLTWQSRAANRYTIESTSDVASGSWTAVAPHFNLPGNDGTMTRTVDPAGAPQGFYRVKIEP